MPKKKDTKKKGRKNRDNRQAVDVACWFCTNNALPDYKEVDTLRVFLSPRGKILPRRNTGVCSTHQRSLATNIKRARQVALIR